MPEFEQQLAELARLHGLAAEAIRNVIRHIRRVSGARYFYIFITQSSGAQSGTSDGAQRERTLLAFQTADAALAFAQANHSPNDQQARVRMLTSIQLIQAILSHQKITSIFVAEETGEPYKRGQFPTGVRFERADLLQQLQQSSDAAM